MSLSFVLLLRNEDAATVPGGVGLSQFGVEEFAVEERPREAHLERQRRAARVVRQDRHLDSLGKTKVIRGVGGFASGLKK